MKCRINLVAAKSHSLSLWLAVNALWIQAAGCTTSSQTFAALEEERGHPISNKPLFSKNDEILAMHTTTHNKNNGGTRRHLEAERRRRRRELQFCVPKPGGGWDCSQEPIEYDNDDFDRTNEPSPRPTVVPSGKPSTTPTSKPTSNPSSNPTSNPTHNPTSKPTPDSTSPLVPKDECEFKWSLLDDRSTTLSSCVSTFYPEMEPSERRLFYGDSICSDNFQYMFGMTNDGYAALCELEPLQGRWMEKIWKVGPFIDRNPSLQFQRTGNLIVRNRLNTEADDYRVMWDAGTEGASMSTLKLQDYGVVQIINHLGDIEWDDAQREGTAMPSRSPSPTQAPTVTQIPTISRSPVGSETYLPGELNFDPVTKLFVSTGLKVRAIAMTNQKVTYRDGQKSDIKFHDQPDAGGCFAAPNGGWYYMSNSEIGADENAEGGVGRITFDANGGVVDYRMVLQNTRMNCGSGHTPWNTYISCEEFSGTNKLPAGQCWEVHPEEKWPARATKMGGAEGGKFESAAFDSRNIRKLQAFVTTDRKAGAVLRFTPHATTLNMALREGDFSNVLHVDGTIDYLVLNSNTGTFVWSPFKTEGEESAGLLFPNTEGIDSIDGFIYFTSKKLRMLFTLDLDNGTYTSSGTINGAFDGQPDQIIKLLPPANYFDKDRDNGINLNGFLYFLEDGGNNPAGVFARDRTGGNYFTIVEGGPDNSDETTGLAFCDNGRRMIFAFQDEGAIFEATREDGMPFYGKTVDIKYHGR